LIMEGLEVDAVPSSKYRKPKWDLNGVIVSLASSVTKNNGVIKVRRDVEKYVFVRRGDGISYFDRKKVCHGIITRIGSRIVKQAQKIVEIEVRRVYKVGELAAAGQDEFEQCLAGQTKPVRKELSEYDLQHEVFLGCLGDSADVMPSLVFAKFSALDKASYEAWYQKPGIIPPADVFVMTQKYDPDDMTLHPLLSRVVIASDICVKAEVRLHAAGNRQ
jgi:hypothetical protein